jgi:hypothetical protein
VSDQATEPVEAPGNGEVEVEDGWLKDRRGRLYVKRPGGGGAVFRREGESIAQAVERDAQRPQGNQDGRPRRKRQTKRPPMPDPPAGVDLRELEKMLAEALKSPAMVCAMLGDEWSANHFTTSGPFLARNLVIASEHNPWLRRKLEEMATGQDAATKMIAVLSLAGAVAMYAVPPIVYFANLPVPDKAREMFGIPPARTHPPDAPAAAPEAAQPVAA